MKIAQIASLPDRVKLLKQTIESLEPQMDRIFVYLNNYKDIPRFINKSGKVFGILCDNTHGDAAKFTDVEQYKGAYIFTCDDDLFYPSDYADTMIEGVNRYRCPVSLHGVVFRQLPIEDYYNDPNKVKYHCLKDVDHDIQAHVVGTGVLCYKHEHVPGLSLKDFELRNMADLWFSRYCKMRGIATVVLKHKANYLKYLHPSRTIWGQHVNNCEIQTDLVNSFV